MAEKLLRGLLRLRPTPVRYENDSARVERAKTLCGLSDAFATEAALEFKILHVVAANACGSADCGGARQVTLYTKYTNFASNKCLKNGAVAIRLQPLVSLPFGFARLLAFPGLFLFNCVIQITPHTKATSLVTRHGAGVVGKTTSI